MTAVLAIRRPDSITLLSDAARLNADRSIAEIGSKVRELGPFAVLICRGSKLVGDWMEQLGRDCAGGRLDSFLRHFPDMCDAAQTVAAENYSAEQLANEQWRDAEIIVAGWHDGFQVTGAWLGTMATRRMDLMAGFQMPGFNINAPVVNYFPPTMEWKEEVEGVDLFNRLRADGAPIGGFLERTTIDRDGLCRGVIHRWPDAVGQTQQASH